MIKRILTIFAVFTLGTAPAFAHISPSEHGSVLAGLAHPIGGLDHILAMIAVGLWAATLNTRSLIALPGAFVSSMLVGYLIGLESPIIPLYEPAILSSVIVIGACAAIALRVSTLTAMLIVGFFGAFHGLAHSVELGSRNVIGFGLGFLISTAILHTVGITVALTSKQIGKNLGYYLPRVIAGTTTVVGVWLMAA